MKKAIFILFASVMMMSCGGSGNGSSNPADSTAVKDSVLVDTTNTGGGGAVTEDGVGPKPTEHIK